MTADREVPRATALPAHLPALDGVRGVAISIVVAHTLSLLDAPTGLFAKALSDILATGWVGVQLFFVLSGFLITGLLLDARGSSNYLSAFFARRLLRIFPLSYATLFVAFVVLPALGRVPPALAHDRPHQIWLWTYLSNWVSTTEAGSRVFPHFWSLAVEEQFYLVWPFVLRDRSAASTLRLCLGVAAASLVARLALLAAGVSHGAIYTFSVTRMDALALGGAVAAALRLPGVTEQLVARRGRLWGASVAILVAGGLVSHRYELKTFAAASVGYSFLASAFSLIVLAAAVSDIGAPSSSPLRAAPLRALGKYSYAIYVFNKPLHDFIGKPLLARLGVDPTRSAVVTIVYVVAGLLASFAAAFASFHLFEKHFLRLKSRFVPRLPKANLLE